MADPPDDVAMGDASSRKWEQNQLQQPKPKPEPKQRSGPSNPSVITSKTITNPPFSYVCLELVSDAAAGTKLDEITVRTYITSALTQFLGLTGSAISVDILKVRKRECWIRVPREDLSPVVAAVGGWMGGNDAEGRVGWRVKASGNWLSALVADRESETLWEI
jgi:ribonuclease P/MRP protein subunit POP8